MVSTTTSKYLEAHSTLKRIGMLPPLPRERFGAVAVVPMYAEAESLPEALGSLFAATPAHGLPSLVIAVLNEKKNSSPEARANNARTLEFLEGVTTPLVILNFTGDNAFENHEGVGLARKLGCDLALYYHHNGQIASPWIHTTDADASVPLDYFTYPLSLAEGLCLYGFEHLPYDGNALFSEALARYDRFLRYYVKGLRHAGSPYAYPTIGSTFAFTASTYAAVRGFPNREAGEDFYFFNKALKVNRAHYAESCVVQLRARVSERVPFGTGKSTLKIADLLASGKPYSVYDWRSFEALKQWLETFERFSHHRSLLTLESELASNGSGLPLQELYANWRLQPLLAAALRQHHKPRALTRFWHDWFDAFRTLKWIHWAREYFPDVSQTEGFIFAADSGTA